VICVRPATKVDIPELIRLRILLFETLGAVTADEGWREACAGILTEGLATPTMRILVVEAGNGLASCGVGTIEQWLPGPDVTDGRIGHISGVVTDPAYRGKGYGHTITLGLLDWFRDRAVTRVDLHASRDAEHLYRSLGFVDQPAPSLYRCS
jgi:GNAT superfamily N-acetyltransferase